MLETDQAKRSHEVAGHNDKTDDGRLGGAEAESTVDEWQGEERSVSEQVN